MNDSARGKKAFEGSMDKGRHIYENWDGLVFGVRLTRIWVSDCGRHRKGIVRKLVYSGHYYHETIPSQICCALSTYAS